MNRLDEIEQRLSAIEAALKITRGLSGGMVPPGWSPSIKPLATTGGGSLAATEPFERAEIRYTPDNTDRRA